MAKTSKLVVLSLGGSLIIPKEGFNIEFIVGFKKMILDYVNDGYRFIIVCGGGQTARLYQNAAKEVGELAPDDIDWIGIHATRLNAHFMRTIFRGHAHPMVVKNPTREEEWDEEILIASGWKPGFSTDFDAVKLAKLYGAKTVINLSNVDYVYDKDPREFKDAKKIDKINWADFRKIVGDEWVPGSNVPFDPIASKEAQELDLKVIFVRGTDLKEVEAGIKGKGYKGTTIEG